jgi:hypothetical protein
MCPSFLTPNIRVFKTAMIQDESAYAKPILQLYQKLPLKTDYSTPQDTIVLHAGPKVMPLSVSSTWLWI